MQKNAWMNKEKMLEFVESLEDTQEHKLLIMDSFCVHRDVEVIESLAQKNFHVVNVPSGHTDIFQPLDVALMKLFKDRIRNGYATWMYTEGIVNGKLAIPSKQQVIEWVIISWFEINTELIRRSFQAVGLN